ncbi:MAG: glycosyltransferase family 2 protein [Planctomycetota bacterium JB042]
MNGPRKVSVVVPTRNGMPRFADVLDGILTQETSWPFELLCVDTDSTDGTWEELERRGIRRRRIARSEFQHGRTRNAAIAETDGDVVVLTVQDATPADPHWLSRLVGALDRADDVAGAYGRQVPYEGFNPLLLRRLEQWSAGAVSPRLQRLPIGVRLTDLPPLERLSLCAFDDVSSCVRRDVWRRFPLPCRPFGEDVAWGKQVIEAGMAIAYAADSVVRHSHDDGALAEFERIYQDHANLHDLFEILTVPTGRSAWTNARAQRRVYHRMLDELSLPEGEDERLRAFATRLAFAETFAQWLGARSVRKGVGGGGPFAWIDRFVRGSNESNESRGEQGRGR